MHDLAHRPSTFAVGSVELRVGKSSHRSPQLGRRFANLLEAGLLLLFRQRAFIAELADGIARIAHASLLKMLFVGDDGVTRLGSRKKREKKSHPPRGRQ